MTRLAPNLFERRFQDLIDLARARLPSLAPEWTDHNAHDPGITLMELLAWVAEAQLYGLSRLRRDERAAYAALLGLAPAGMQGARGILWPDRDDPRSPAATLPHSVVIPPDAAANVVGAEDPTFRPTGPLLWVPGRIQSLKARHRDGTTTDCTAVNARGGTAFLPFGASASRRDVLALTFACRGEAGLFGSDRRAARGARWAIGVRAAAPLGATGADDRDPCRARRSPLEATLVIGGDRIRVEIVSDSTAGMLTTGALLLDLDSVPGSPRELTLELSPAGGLARPPRVLRIEPGVIPIQQGRAISRELHVAPGLPDWTFDLDAAGLCFAAGDEPIQMLEVAEPGGLTEWTRCDRLADRGPADRVYELDASTGRVAFGNGVNGAIPPARSQVLVSYRVSDGDQGVVARNRRWQLAGFSGAFGVNLDPVVEGAAPAGWIDQRREARRRVRQEHALASADDLVAAATGLPLLEVARAWVPPLDGAPPDGQVALVAMRARPDGQEPADSPESARWLEAVRSRLAQRVPLGTRLAVVAPRYVPFSIAATLEAEPSRDPAAVQAAALAALRGRLALVSSAPGAPVRSPGVPVTQRDVSSWLRAVDGVRRVLALRLLDGRGREVASIAVPARGLPRCDFAASALDVRRAGGNGP